MKMVAVHNPGKTTNLVIRVVLCPRADISLAWFLTCAKSLASPTLAEIAMQANLCDRILLGRKGKFRRHASALCVLLARPKPKILTGAYHAGYLREYQRREILRAC